jgi:hypothetical protein
VQLPGAPDTLRKPEHACAVGLLLLAAEQRRHAVPRRRAPLFGGMSKWFKGLIKDS